LHFFKKRVKKYEEVIWAIEEKIIPKTGVKITTCALVAAVLCRGIELTRARGVVMSAPAVSLWCLGIHLVG
jgi:hypothetical protein